MAECSRNPAAHDLPRARFKCSTCHKAYSSSSHLRRHERTHNDQLFASCPICGKSFKKKDVARRHSVQCAAKRQLAPPTEQKRGRKRRACSTCVRRKRACDGEDPCALCRSTNRECVYPDATPSSMTPSESAAASTPVANENDDLTISFLKGFSDLSIAGPRPTFLEEALKTHSGQASTSEPELPRRQSLADDHESQLQYGHLSFSLSSSFHDDCSTERDCHAPQSDHDSILKARMASIVDGLCNTHEKLKESQESQKAYFDEKLARSIFTSSNLELFSWAYFQRLHPGQPILHVPTFKLEKASNRLLLVIFLSGSFFCAPSDDAISTGPFSDIGEEYIFSHPIFHSGLTGDDEEDFEALAAALMVQFGQMHSDSAAIRHRSRTQRHKILTSAIEASGYLTTRHAFPLSQAKASDWKQFATSESRIRLAQWMFFADVHLNVMFNNPLQLQVTEMTGQLPCSKALFGAETADEFERLAAVERTDQRPASLEHFIQFLSQDQWSGLEDKTYRGVTVMHLMVAAHAVHNLSYNLRLEPAQSRDIDQIVLMTDRWKKLWDGIKGKDESEEGQYIAFPDHADEVWWLTRTIMKLLRQGPSSDSYVRGVETDSMDGLNNLIRTYSRK